MSLGSRTPDHHGHADAGAPGPRSGSSPARPEALSYAVARALGTVVVTVHGDVDVEGSKALERALDDLVEGQGNRAVAVDLRKARIVTPEALDAFYALGYRARRQGTSFTVSAPAGAAGPGADEVGGADVIRIDRPPKRRR